MSVPPLSRLSTIARHLPLVAALALSGIALAGALERYLYARMCLMTCGPFSDPQFVLRDQAAMDWHTPLALGATPLALCSVWWVWRAAKRRALRR